MLVGSRAVETRAVENLVGQLLAAGMRVLAERVEVQVVFVGTLKEQRVAAVLLAQIELAVFDSTE